VTDYGTATFSLYQRGGRALAVMSITKAGVANVDLYDSAQHRRAQMWVDERGELQLGFYDAHGNVVKKLAADLEGRK